MIALLLWDGAHLICAGVAVDCIREHFQKHLCGGPFVILSLSLVLTQLLQSVTAASYSRPAWTSVFMKFPVQYDWLRCFMFFVLLLSTFNVHVSFSLLIYFQWEMRQLVPKPLYIYIDWWEFHVQVGNFYWDETHARHNTGHTHRHACTYTATHHHTNEGIAWRCTRVYFPLAFPSQRSEVNGFCVALGGVFWKNCDRSGGTLW